MDAKTIFNAMASARRDQRPSKINSAALPAAALTYAQGGEDWALYKRLKNIVPAERMGFYVDIGCGQPHVISNTYLFYTFGWRGLCIDANDEHAPAWATHRPRDIFVCQAIGKENGTATFFRSATTNWGMAALGDTPPEGGKFQPGIRVPVRRLEEVFAEHLADQDIDFMTIDVEGSEEGVLASNDWSRWRPRVILVECRGFSFDAPRILPAVRVVIDQNYELAEKIGENLMFVRE